LTGAIEAISAKRQIFVSSANDETTLIHCTARGVAKGNMFIAARPNPALPQNRAL
jgi:hypothetical protein